MENYTLKNDETVLYRGSAIIMPDGKNEDKNAQKSDVLLTNFNIIVFQTKKKLFKTTTEPVIYNVSDVKIYDEQVQVIRRKAIVDVYLKTGELFLNFKKEKEAKLFTDKALRLISGESKLVRSVKKVKKEIRETDEALDIDIEGSVVKGAKLAASITVDVAALKSAGNKTKIFGKIAENLMGKKNEKNENTLPEPKSESVEEESV